MTREEVELKVIRIVAMTEEPSYKGGLWAPSAPIELEDIPKYLEIEFKITISEKEASNLFFAETDDYVELVCQKLGIE